MLQVKRALALIALVLAGFLVAFGSPAANAAATGGDQVYSPKTIHCC